MKTPPLLLGAALLFWGWQAGFLIAGACMAAVLESARFIKRRWEFSDDDFSRIWTVCTVMFLGAVVYAFTDNGGPVRFGNLLQNSNLAALNSAGTASARTASAILRWLPMVLFLFVAAQAYSAREEIPLSTISLIMRRRWKRAEKLGQPLPPARGMNVAYPYFAVCLFASSIHSSENNTFFLGLCLLLAWALWSRRTRRFGVWIWSGALAVVLVSGYFGQQGIGHLQSYLQNLDTQWIARFLRGRSTNATLSRTAMGQIGELKTSTRIVIRLETRDGAEAPAYLREASYRIFAAPDWRVSNVKDDFDLVPYGTTNTTWLLIPDKTNTAAVRIACYLDGRTREPEAPSGLLPLPSGCGRLENLPAFTLRQNGAGAVLAEGPGLVIFDALYGPGRTADDPPLVTLQTNDDLAVPIREQPALDQVISEQQFTNLGTEQTLQAVNRYFQRQFTYSTWQGEEYPPDPVARPGSRRRRERAGFVSTNETPLARFLLRSHSGHCEYFATATVLLLRQLGIPARYAVGYAVHEPAGKGYVVRLRDSHAWCLVWNQETRCWQDFDTTPPSWLAEESKRKSPFLWLADFWSWIKFQFAKFRWGQTHLQRYVLLILGPVLVLLIAQIFLRRRRQRQRHKDREAAPAVAWPGLDSEFYLVESKLLERGVIRRPNEPLSEWLARAIKTHGALTGADGSLRDLLRLHYRYRFDPQGLNEMDREQLKQRTRSALEVLGGGMNRN